MPKNEIELSLPIRFGRVYHENQTDNDVTDHIVWSMLKSTQNYRGLSNWVWFVKKTRHENVVIDRVGGLRQKTKLSLCLQSNQVMSITKTR